MKSISYVRERIDDQCHKAPVREHAPGTAIAPLASRGIVGQATLKTIVYDAETTHGGNGGPVLDMQGNVVAVNAAILPEYGGSSLGVPAAKLWALLEEAGLR